MKTMRFYLYFVVLAVLLMPNIVGAAQSRDDGLSQFTLGISYKELLELLGKEEMCSRKADFLAGKRVQGVFEEYDTLLYDKKNGYMEWTQDPTPCGCDGTITAAAYSKKDGTCLFLKNSKIFCNYSHVDGILASEPIASYMPVGFGLKLFLPEHFALPNSDEAAFFLAVDIPRKGTTTTLHLKQIPFGLYVPSIALLLDDAPFLSLTDKTKDLLQANDPQLSLESGSFYKSYNVVREIALIFFDPEQFNDVTYPTELPKKELQEMVLSGNISAIGEKDRSMLEKLASDNNPDVSLEHISARFRFFYMVYQIEQNLVWDTCTMEWNPSEGRFYITKKWFSRKKPSSFLDFLRNAYFWSAAC